jgi:hypothetical protein
MQYIFNTFGYNFKYTRKQSPFITRASEDAPMGPKPVRRFC